MGERVWAECGCVHKWHADGSREYWGCTDFATSATLWLTRAQHELSDGRVNSASGHHGVARPKTMSSSTVLFFFTHTSRAGPRSIAPTVPDFKVEVRPG